MIKVFKKKYLINTRLCPVRNLVFFVIILSCSCGHKEERGIHIVWKNNKASGISLPESLFDETDSDTLSKFLKISLFSDKDSTAILGDIKRGSTIVFEPLLPFTHGLKYIVFFRSKKIGEFNIPNAGAHNAPQLITLYPLQDTVPENLLKIYLAFSHAMSEGHSDKYITLIKNETDTLHDVFLNLQPELWNEDRTVITVWLDPGRIKRDLQPNLRLGSPLRMGDKYHLVVSHQWKDARDIPLQKDFVRFFVAGARDSLSPDPDHWALIPPPASSNHALNITLDEPLDHYLLLETVQVKNEQREMVKGKVEIYNEEKNIRFIPAGLWLEGNYSLTIESRLEDLAGNNLNRPFDRDITQGKTPGDKGTFERRFRVK